MTKKRAQRSETMIALRARRLAFTVANEIRNPRVDVGQTVCPHCHSEVHVLDSHEQHAVDCARCGARSNWPEDFVARAVPLLDGSVRLHHEDAPACAVFLSCVNCRTEQWFRSVDETYGVFCARCDQELIPPSDDFERRCAKVALQQRKREAFYAVSGVVILALMIAIAVVHLFGSGLGM